MASAISRPLSSRRCCKHCLGLLRFPHASTRPEASPGAPEDIQSLPPLQAPANYNLSQIEEEIRKTVPQRISLMRSVLCKAGTRRALALFPHHVTSIGSWHVADEMGFGVMFGQS
jgi:hypothetical protein